MSRGQSEHSRLASQGKAALLATGIGVQEGESFSELETFGFGRGIRRRHGVASAFAAAQLPPSLPQLRRDETA